MFVHLPMPKTGILVVQKEVLMIMVVNGAECILIQD